MKHGYINHLFLVCTLAFISFSCIKENAQVDDTICNEGSFRATVEGSENAKTVLKNDGAVVWWEPNDEILVFCGNQKGVFTSNATAASATTTFVGETHFSSEEGTPFLAVYPNSEDVAYDGTEAVVTIPHEQIAEAGTFDRRAFVMMAESNNRILNFKNLCGGIKISVSQSGINKIVLRGNSKEVLAGKVKAQFSEGIPVVTEVLDGQNTIELRCENNASFETGKWYFFSCLPTTLSNGFSIELYGTIRGYNCIGDYTKNDAEYSIQRSRWSRIQNASGAASFVPTSSDNKLLYTTTDNTLATLRTTGIVAKHSSEWIGSIRYGTIEFNEGVTSFGALFDDESKTKIKLVIIPNSITSIGNGAFSGCTGLTSVTIPNSIASIGNHAFDSCTGLTRVNISSLDAWCKISFPSGTANPLYYAHTLYLNDTKITKLVIPDSVPAISPYAFYGCSGLTSVTFPDSVSSIGAAAFYECSGLTGPLTLPNNLTSIGGSAFSHCTGLTGTLSVPNSVTSIGNYAFAYCSGLTSATIPNSVTTIGNYAFAYCSGLTSATIPNSATTIGENAFKNCSNLYRLTISGEGPSHALDKTPFSGCTITEVAFSEGISSIADEALHDYGWRDVQNIIIPSSITAIGRYAFGTNNKVKNIHISDLEAWCNISFGGNPIDYYYDLYLNGVLITDLIIPCNVSILRDYTFFWCHSIVSVSFHNNMTSIGNHVFEWCTNLTDVSLSDSVTSIGAGAFYDCSGLASITIPNSVTSIGAGAFYGCSRLTSVTIPNSVTSIGASAFFGCRRLTSVTIPNSVSSIPDDVFGACENLTSITIPNSVTSIGAGAFQNCFGLTSITIPNSVTSIDKYAFYGCTGLSYVAIPSSVTSIGDGAFMRCYGLTSVTIPSNVSFLGEEAFYLCSSLTNVIALPSTPPAGGVRMFANNADSRMIYVPFNSVGDYQTAEYWKDYSSSITYIQ